MAKDNDSTQLREKLLDFVTDPDPLLSMLEWLTSRLMKLEAEAKVGVEKGKHDESRTTNFSGIRVRRFDTRLGTMYLLVPKLRRGGYIPFFVTERKRSEHALIEMVLEAYANGVSTREILAVQPMWNESEESYTELFESLKARGLSSVHLIVSDAHKGLQGAIKREFLNSSWQRCKVHFMRNILSRVGHRDKEVFAAKLKQVWLQTGKEGARRAARELADEYALRFPDAIAALEDGLEDSLSFYDFPMLDARKIS